MEQSNNDPPLATTHSPLKLCTRPHRRSGERERERETVRERAKKGSAGERDRDRGGGADGGAPDAPESPLRLASEGYASCFPQTNAR